MTLKGKRIGIVSPGGEIRAYFNAGVLAEFMRREIKISRIAGTSGGIMCILPFFQSRNHKEYEDSVKKSIARELISTDWIREFKEMFKERIFHYTPHMDLEVDIDIDTRFIKKEYFNKTPALDQRLKGTDVIVSVTSIQEGIPVQSRRFNISSMCLEGEKGISKASEIIRAAATIFSKSEPVEWFENGVKTFLLDGYYTDNIPMSEMFTDNLYNPENSVDIIFVINNSNLKNYFGLMEQIQALKKEYFGLNRYSFQFKSLMRYAEMSLSISGNDKEQIETTVSMNRMLRNKLLKEGKDPEQEYGKPFKLSDSHSKEFTLKPIYIIEPQAKEQDIQLLSSEKDKESVAEKNFFLGKNETSQILDLIEAGKLFPY